MGRLFEEFKDEYNELAKLADKASDRTLGRQLKDVVTKISDLDSKEKKLADLKAKKINKGELSDREQRHEKELKSDIEDMKDKMKEAKAIGKKIEADEERISHEEKAKEEPKKEKERIEKKVGAEPEVNLRKIRTGMQGSRFTPNEEWKQRVRDYLGEGKGFRFGKCSMCKKTMPLPDGKTCKKCSKKNCVKV